MFILGIIVGFAVAVAALLFLKQYKIVDRKSDGE